MKDRRLTFNELLEVIPDKNSANPYWEIVELAMNDIRIFESRKNTKDKNLSIKIQSKYPSGVIEFDTLNTLLSGIQSLVLSAFNDLVGNKNDKGPIPEAIQNLSRLLVTSIQPGSFIVNFDFAENKNLIEYPPFLPTEIDKSPYEMINDLIVGINSIDSTETLNNVIIDRHSKRTIQNIIRLFKDIEKKDVSFTYSNGLHDTKITFDKPIIHNINKAFSKVKKFTETTFEELIGTLVAFDVQRGSISLELSSDNIIKISIIDKKLDYINLVSNVKYRIKVTIKKDIDVHTDEVIDIKYFAEDAEVSIRQL